MGRLEDFFVELDAKWPEQPQAPIELLVIGCGALMLQTRYERGTNDGDVLETLELTPEIKTKLVSLAGKQSTIHKRTSVYIDIVGNGIPFLPLHPLWREVPTLDRTFVSFRVKALDVVDVVVSKLKRLSANDLDDIEAMVNRGSVPHDRLLERFRSAFDLWSADARASSLPQYVRNLNQVERDILAASETPFDLDRLHY